MRINKYLAAHSQLSRRAADKAITDGRVEINGIIGKLGDTVIDSDIITLDGRRVSNEAPKQTIMLNKPVGYVCSRAGQGSKTVYDLLPPELHHLQPVGRLDKASGGLLLLTNDGDLANLLTHPRHQKQKKYVVTLNKELDIQDQETIDKHGVTLEDGLSRLSLSPTPEGPRVWVVTMSEGRNRQVRRTFDALGYTVTRLFRTDFGPYQLERLEPGEYRLITM